MPVAAAKGWDELARAIIQDILEKQGGTAALLPFVSLFFMIVVVGMAWYVVRQKQKEIDRMASDRKPLEELVLKKRLSSSDPKKPKRRRS
jgi:hypothetical protein